MPKKLPYGQSDFAKIIEQNYAYVDKTRYIELLENENNTFQFILRPRRFGKSLFLSLLENYYDINKKNEYESLFGNLYIGRNPTPEQGKYAILRFDFSVLDTETHDLFRKSFSNTVQERVINFLKMYSDIFKDVKQDIKLIKENNLGTDALEIAYTAAADADVPIFVIVDEYDNFANDLIAMGKDYKNEVQAGGLVRTFYKSLKAATSSVVKRIFITGVSPMMINDLTSGFNIATDYSLFPKYNEMFGFTKEEVEWVMKEAGVDRDLIKVDMEAYYNGYMFNEEGTNKVYNSQMVLYLFNMIMQLDKQPNEIVDANLKTDYGRLRSLVNNKSNGEKLLKIATDGKIAANITEKFSFDKMMSEDYFISLLFYIGMLTVDDVVEGQLYVKIPNYSIQTLYWDYVISYLRDMEDDNDGASTLVLAEKVREMAFRGNIKPFINYFTENYLKHLLSNRDLQRFNEKNIKMLMLAKLYDSGLYLPKSEDENVNGYVDIYAQKHPAKPTIKYEYVIEVKYAKTNAAEAEIAAKISEAKTQIEKYKKDNRFVDRNDVKFAALLFKGKGDCEVIYES